MSRHGIRLAAVHAVSLLLWAADAEAAAWTELSDDCLTHLYETEAPARPLTAACPELAEALRADPWSALLVRSVDELPAWAVTDLAAFAGHYTGPADGPGVDAGALDAVLAALADPVEDETLSLWERLVEWLGEWLGGDDEVLPDWLSELSLPDGAVKGILIGSVVLITLLALAVIVNEIRHHRRRAGHRPATAETAAGQPPADGELADDTPGAPLGMLFAAVVARLQAAGRLPARRSLTHREVTAAANLSEGQRDSVRMIARAAERVRYGSWNPGQADLAGCQQAGRRLLDELAGGGA